MYRLMSGNRRMHISCKEHGQRVQIVHGRRGANPYGEVQSGLASAARNIIDDMAGGNRRTSIPSRISGDS